MGTRHWCTAIIVAVLCVGPSVANAQQRPVTQRRSHGVRVVVDPSTVSVDDGDTVVIRWGPKEEETVRILGIDTPETRHLGHDIPYEQSQGPEALAFARGAFAAASDVRLLRASTLDPYGRTLAYIFLNGRNYSLLVIRARLAYESVGQFGDNGFPGEAAEVAAAAKEAGPLPFEPPHLYRARMRELSKVLKTKGLYPTQE